MASNRFPPQPATNDVRLPSIKDLNFYRPSHSSSSWPNQRQQQPARQDSGQSTKRESEEQQTRNEPVLGYNQYPAPYHPHEPQHHQHHHQQQQQQQHQPQPQPQQQQHYPYYPHPPHPPHQPQSQQQPRPPAPPRPAYQQEHAQQYPPNYFSRPPPPTHAQPAQQQQQPNPAPAVYQPHYPPAQPQYHPQSYGRSSPDDPKTSLSLHHQDTRLSELLNHCTILCDFARRYASTPHLQPTLEERTAMQRKSDKVVTLLTDIRDATFPSSSSLSATPSTTSTLKSDHQFILQDGRRPPKRPWEDMAHDSQDNRPSSEVPTTNAQDPLKLAERDMEIIRSKRATTAAQANGTTADANSKSKYRKRSRASPPGKCHSCNIRETPEWRRGPDGARTLCNACGLHYAKLMRKRDKANGGDSAPSINIESVRASVQHENSGQGHDHNIKDAPSPATSSSSSLPIIPHSSSSNTHINTTSPVYDHMQSYRGSPPSTTTQSTYPTPPDLSFNSGAQSFMRHSR